MKFVSFKIFLIFFIIFGITAFANELKVGKNYQFKNFSEALINAKDKDTLLVDGGNYTGNFIIDKQLVLIGKNNPVINGNGKGTVLNVKVPNVIIQGLTIKNSGILLDKEDAGILVESNNVLIQKNIFKEVLFGVYFKRADNGIVRNNLIEGKKELDIPRRGDLFRAWYSKNLLLEKNQFNFGRDVIIWFAEGAVIKNNNVSNARYGLHFMYSNDCKVLYNIFTSNSVGMYLMYSKNLEIENNLIAYNRGPSGFGVGLKDLDNVKINRNVIADNRVGIFIDNSPRSFDSEMLYYKNVIGYNETGVDAISSLSNSYFKDNSFIENYHQAALSSGQNSNNNFWEGNYWSDYSGYDKDKDGVGDIYYRQIDLIESLVEDKPELKYFLYSPAINAINYAAQAFPIFQPEPKLIDRKPLMKPDMPLTIPSLKIQKETQFIFLSIFLTIFSSLLIVVFVFKNRIVHLKN